MANDITHTYTNDGNENPYTVYRILQETGNRLMTTDSVVEAIEAAMTEIVPNVSDPGDHFAAALDVAVNAGISFFDGITDQPWLVRRGREETLLAEALVYARQLCPAVFTFTPRIG